MTISSTAQFAIGSRTSSGRSVERRLRRRVLTSQSLSARRLLKSFAVTQFCVSPTMTASVVVCMCLVMFCVAASIVAAPFRDTEGTEPCSPDKLTVYKVVLHTFWSRDKFPKHYPDWRPPAQWSKVFGELTPHEVIFLLAVATSGLPSSRFDDRGSRDRNSPCGCEEVVSGYGGRDAFSGRVFKLCYL